MACKNLKMSQNKLSKELDVSHTTIARMENGEINVSLELFISVANLLGYGLILQKNDDGNNLSKNMQSSECELEMIIKKFYDVINDDDNIFDKDVLVLKKVK